MRPSVSIAAFSMRCRQSPHSVRCGPLASIGGKLERAAPVWDLVGLARRTACLEWLPTRQVLPDWADAASSWSKRFVGRALLLHALPTRRVHVACGAAVPHSRLPWLHPSMPSLGERECRARAERCPCSVASVESVMQRRPLRSCLNVQERQVSRVLHGH